MTIEMLQQWVERILWTP